MIKKFAIALVVAVLLSLGIGFFLPRGWRVERQVVIAATPAQVHALLFDLRCLRAEDEQGFIDQLSALGC